MSITCPECSIRYATDLPACPWCGHAPESAATPADIPAESASSPAHTETRSAPPPPPPPARTPGSKASVTYNLADIPGPDEDWEPVDDWIAQRPDDAGEMDPEERRLRRWVLIGGGVIALLAFGAFLAEVLPIGGQSSSSEPAPTAAAAPTTTPPPATTLPPTTTTLPPATTVPPTTAATPLAVEPIGSAIDAGDLRLGEDGLGVLEFGSDGNEAVGRLAATFGQPDFDSGVRAAPAEEGGGFCEGEQQRQVRWGSLSVYLSVAADGTQALASAQVIANDATDPDPGSAIASISGLGVGNSIADLRTIYDGFRIDLFEETGGGLWELRAGSDGRLLLWGTMSGGTPESENVITSLRSSLRCDG